MTPPAPIVFKPWLRPMPWGGTQLCNLFDGTLSGNSIGEAWLLSDHPLHQSLTQSNDQLSLQAVLNFGSAVKPLDDKTKRFPLLIKLLDAQQNLSIQVHPDDQVAAHWSPGEGGKTEAWIVLAVEPGAAIYLGLKPGIDLSTFARELSAGNAPLCLNRLEPKVGDAYFVPAGAVHALGQGILVLEVQQTSDATFRLYDWGRICPDGKHRALHLEAGLACTQLAPAGAGLQRPQRDPDGAERLVQCPFFSIRRWTSGKQITVTGPSIIIPWGNSARSLIDGSEIKQGYACLIPETIKQAAFELSPDTTFFEIRWSAKD